ALAGALMALTMAAVTGRGVVLLVRATPAAPLRSSRPAAWTVTAAEVAAGLGVDPRTGLDDQSAATRLADEGPNEVGGRRRVSVARSVLRELTDTLILVLLGAAVLTAATGDWVDCAVIAL